MNNDLIFPELYVHTTDFGAFKCGTLPTPESFEFKQSIPMMGIDPSQFIEFEYPEGIIPIKDQNGYGACVGHASATSMEWKRYLMGMPLLELSPWFVYAILCNGVDRGASIGQALDLCASKGTCPFTDVPYGTINPRKLTDAAKTDATRFRIEIGSKAPDFDYMLQTTQAGNPGNFSIHVGGGFNNLDSEGCPPAGGGSGNHSVTYGLGARKMKNGKWKIKCQNSWTIKWGLKGYFWINENHINRQNGFEAYDIRSVFEDPNSGQLPPLLTL